MTKPDDSKPPPPPAGDVENQTAATDGSGSGSGTGVVSNIIQRWKREDILKRGSLTLRFFGFILSLLAFILMASNKHGDNKFDEFEEFKYVLAIAILSTMYTGLQIWRQIHELSTAREVISRQNMTTIDYFGDQITAYLLLSSASSAIPMTNRLREGTDNIFTDSSSAAIAMEFLAFVCIGLSALISGFKLSHQTYI